MLDEIRSPASNTYTRAYDFCIRNDAEVPTLIAFHNDFHLRIYVYCDINRDNICDNACSIIYRYYRRRYFSAGKTSRLRYRAAVQLAIISKILKERSARNRGT